MKYHINIAISRQDVSQKVETKTAEECCKHFFRFFVHGRMGKAFIDPRRPSSVQDHTTSEGAPLSPSLYTVLPPADLSPEEQQLLGFMPKRDDFERVRCSSHACSESSLLKDEYHLLSGL